MITSIFSNFAELLLRKCLTPLSPRPEVKDLASKLPRYTADDRPTILVLPMFFSVGGVERNTIELIRALRHKFRFVVIGTEASPQKDDLETQFIEVSEFTLNLSKEWHASLHLSALSTIKDHFQIKLVWICNGSHWLLKNRAKLSRLFWKIPIIDQQAYDNKVGWIQTYKYPSMRLCEKFIAINKKIKASMTDKFGIHPDRISMIYSILNLKRYGLSKLDFPDISIGFMGRMVDQKDPIAFLDLAHRALSTFPSMKFVMVGDGPLSTEIQAHIEKNKLSNVTRIKYVSDTSEVLENISALVISSKFEGLPIAMLEALSWGVPIFSTDVGEIKELLKEYKVGQCYSPDLSKDEKWKNFCNFIENIWEFRESARKHAEKIRCRFSPVNAATQYEKVFLEALVKCRS